MAEWVKFEGPDDQTVTINPANCFALIESDVEGYVLVKSTGGAKVAVKGDQDTVARRLGNLER